MKRLTAWLASLFPQPPPGLHPETVKALAADEGVPAWALPSSSLRMFQGLSDDLHLTMRDVVVLNRANSQHITRISALENKVAALENAQAERETPPQKPKRRRRVV